MSLSTPEIYDIPHIEQLLRQEAIHPGTIDKVLIVRHIQHHIRRATSPLPHPLLHWYAATLSHWRRSLRAYRPLADVAPADRPRIRRLLLTDSR